MRLQTAACIDDLAILARRRMPSFIFDFLDGGAGRDRGVAHNLAALQRLRLRMVPLAGVKQPDMEVTLFGRKYSMPIGVAPMGMANLFWPETDLALARMAQRERIPYCMSTASSTSIEDTARVAPEHTWFQLYTPRTEAVRTDLLRRAAGAGIEVLAVTVDVPGAPRRNRNIHNGFSTDFSFTPKIALKLIARPRWALATLAAGSPRPGNYGALDTQAKPVGSAVAATRAAGSQNKGEITWDDFRRLREDWKGKLLVKGVLDPDAAKELVAHGADGIWISNHGGRQLESAMATIDALPLIRQTVGPDFPLIFDGGVRGGEDIVKACALGADMVFSGRCFGFAAGAGGAEGADKAFEILHDDLRGNLIQMGCPSVRALNPDWVLAPRPGANT